MTQLHFKLSEYLKEVVGKGIESAGSAEYRVVFRGPPLTTLRSLFHSHKIDGCLPISRSGSSAPLRVPLYLIDADSPEVIEGSMQACDWNEVISRRGYERHMVVLAPHSESPLESFSKASRPIGQTEVITQTDAPLQFEQDNSLVYYLIQPHLTQLCADAAAHSVAISWLVQVLHQISRCFPQRESHEIQWKIIERIACTDLADVSWEGYAAKLGLPCYGSARPVESTVKEALLVLDKLASHLSDKGFNAGFRELSEGESDKTISWLIAAESHLHQLASNAQKFSGCPIAYYYPEQSQWNSPRQPPEWWRGLTIDLIQTILGAPSVQAPEAATLSLTNAISPGTGGAPLVQARPKFRIQRPTSALQLPAILKWSLGKDSAQIDIPPGQNEIEWECPIHDKPVRFEVQFDGCLPGKLSLISLHSYTPGIVLIGGSDAKSKLFHIDKKRDKSGATYIGSCEVPTSGKHVFSLHWNPETISNLRDFKIAREIEADQVHIGCHVVHKDANRLRIEVEVPPASQGGADLQFIADAVVGSVLQQRTFIVEVEAHDEESNPCPDMYSALIHQLRTGKGIPTIDVRSTWAREYSVWALNQPDYSHYPMVLGTDYRKQQLPDGRPEGGVFVLSTTPQACSLVARDAYQPPASLLEYRRRVFVHVKKALEDQNCDYPEELRLDRAFSPPNATEDLSEYLREYAKFIGQTSLAASWYDVIGIFERGHGSPTLGLTPTAILIHPLHPIRLAWQVVAQRAIGKSIAQGFKSLIAGSLPCHSMPDALVVACLKPAGTREEVPFVSVPSDSSYWQVLWNARDGAGLSGTAQSGGIMESAFGEQIGIIVGGLNQGLTDGQVRRALGDVSTVLPAISVLKTELHSNHGGSSAVDAGIFQWAKENLGPADTWFPIVHRRLEVVDSRHHQPVATSSLADISRSTSSSLLWREKGAETAKYRVHLGIVSHVGSSNPDLSGGVTRSALGPGCLVRARVRSGRRTDTGRNLIIESRVSDYNSLAFEDVLESNLTQAVATCENLLKRIMAGGVPATQLAFSTNTSALEQSVENSSFTAIASGETDPSEFIHGGRTYLWDYDLPIPSSGGNQEAGYYLVASQGQSQALSVASACIEKLKEVSGDSGKDIPSISVHDLLTEVSLRGVPTLKSIHSGGTSASGSLAALASLRLLQPDFSAHISGRASGLFPIHSANRVRLAIPVDPFEDQLEQLRRERGLSAKSLRPDFILASIDVTEGEGCKIALTAVEVKFRTSEITQSDIEDAYAQLEAMNEVLAILLKAITEAQGSTSLHEIASIEVLITWLDFAFRTYGRTCDTLHREQWSILHQRVLLSLCQRRAEIAVVPHGRLIVVHKCTASRPMDLIDGDYRRLELTHSDCLRLLSPQLELICTAATTALGDWGLDNTDLKSHQLTEAQGSAPSTEATKSNLQPPPSSGTNSTAVSPILPIPTNPLNSIVEKNLSRDVTGGSDHLPESGEGIRFSVGETTGELRPTMAHFWPSNCALNHLNIGIVGDMGTGKTQLTKFLIAQMALAAKENRGQGVKFLIFDYKRDYSDKAFVDRVNAKVFSPHQLPLNILSVPPGSIATNRIIFERASFLFDTLSRVRSGAGMRQRERCKQAVKGAYEASGNGAAPLLGDVLDRYLHLAEGDYDTIASLLSDLRDLEIFSDDPSKIVPFDSFFSGVTVIKLSELGTQEHAKTIVVAFMLSMFYEYMIRLEKKPFIGSDPQLRFIDSMVLIDEADNIMRGNFGILQQILTQGREFGVGALLASQYLSHFRKEEYDYTEPLLTWFIHKVPQVTVADLRSVGIALPSHEALEAIKKMPNLHCFIKTLDWESRVIKTIPFYKFLESSPRPT